MLKMDDGESFNGGSHLTITRTGDFTCSLSCLLLQFSIFLIFPVSKLVIAKRGLVFR
jgi:hypothetical protein